MCRLFGFKSIITSQVHSSLANADNSLHTLSEKHPDGWGIAYYHENTPHLIRSSESALSSTVFQKIANIIKSQTVIAHIRKATLGEKTILNSHPFQYGRWTFAHNGNIKNFSEVKDDLFKLINPKLSPLIMGTTDSEVVFFIILTEIEKSISLDSVDIKMSDIFLPIEKAIKNINAIIGNFTYNKNPIPSENYISFLISNGDLLCGLQGGQELYFCTHKKKCPERDACAFFNESCEKESQSGTTVNHLLISSGQFMDYNEWQELKPGDLIGTDSSMELFKTQINGLF